ncbi:unnamed protein product [Absidia cylindrospora]
MNIAELLIPVPESSYQKSSSKIITKKFPCSWPDCAKSFGRPSDATRHYRIHTNDRRFVCELPFCGKRFIQRSALTVHCRTHSKERPHHCEFIGCSKTFSDSSSLARHRRIHTGDRPYKCDICKKSYTKKYLLVCHTQRQCCDGQQSPLIATSPTINTGLSQGHHDLVTPSPTTASLSYYSYHQYNKSYSSPVSPSSTYFTSNVVDSSPNSSPSSMISSLSSPFPYSPNTFPI